MRTPTFYGGFEVYPHKWVTRGEVIKMAGAFYVHPSDKGALVDRLTFESPYADPDWSRYLMVGAR